MSDIVVVEQPKKPERPIERTPEIPCKDCKHYYYRRPVSHHCMIEPRKTFGFLLNLGNGPEFRSWSAYPDVDPDMDTCNKAEKRAPE
jgi:hypothetical protein